MHFGFMISNPDANPAISEALKASPEKASNSGTLMSLLGLSREVIIQAVGEDKYEFVLVGFSIDAKTGSFILSPDLRFLEQDKNAAMETIAACMALDVPVYPDDDKASAALEDLLSTLYLTGFESEIEGKPVRLKYRGERGLRFNTETGVLESNVTASIAPGDALLAAGQARLVERDSAAAHALLVSLRNGIDELESLLALSTRDEEALQRCLTIWPVLFGLDYKRVIPKYMLGSDYVTDYALERHSGLIDVVEIEPSTMKLYTKAGNPRADLVHAEQQVLDWLEWLEANARLARDDLPQMMRPFGQVVIGRSGDLSEANARRLLRRNASFRGVLEILTYDDIVRRAKDMLSVLQGPDSLSK
jgi:hypothetical protein